MNWSSLVTGKLKIFYNKQQYHPSWLGLFVHPFYFARKGLFEHISALAPKVTGRILDVGCGQKPYADLFNASDYVGLEIDSVDNRQNKKADCYYNGTVFPFMGGEFDSVILSQVFEHVFTPDVFLCEVHRVLAEGGVLLMSVPFVWDEHEQPHDYARYTSFGLCSLLERHGFVVVEHRKSVNDIRVVFQMLNGFIYKKTITKNNYLNLFVTLLLISPFNILGELLSKLLPENNDLYLDNVVLAKKTTHV
jgi:SAM-dependent methyltransferase